jgi:mRNA-degrading endonuclease toxin of MazEF toxin-antitoxin module
LASRARGSPRQGEIYWADLEPGRQAVMVVSPDEMNRVLSTVIVAPLMPSNGDWPTRFPVSVRAKVRAVALDQIRCLPVKRLARRVGRADAAPARRILRQMFS